MMGGWRWAEFTLLNKMASDEHGKLQFVVSL